MDDSFSFKPKKGKLMLDSEDSLDNFKYFQKPQQERPEKPNTSFKMEIEPSPSIKKLSNQRLDIALTPRDQNRLSTTSNTRSEPDSGKLVIRKEAPVSRPSSSAMVEERKTSDTTSRKSISEKPQTPKTNKMRVEESESEEAEETDSEENSDDDSDDDDDSESEEAEDSDEDEPVRKRRQSTKSTKSEKSAQSKKSTKSTKSSRNEPMIDAKTGMKKVLKTKDDLVYDVLKRWWYCLPDWPPVNYDYKPALLKNRLRVVDFKNFRNEREVSEEGYKKVYEVPSYPGIFKNSKGEFIDLRPKESCPCYDNFKKKSVVELLELLVKAYTNQIEVLERQEKFDPSLVAVLRKELMISQKTLEIQRNKNTVAV